jgi:hypothetical protein
MEEAMGRLLWLFGGMLALVLLVVCVVNMDGASAQASDALLAGAAVPVVQEDFDEGNLTYTQLAVDMALCPSNAGDCAWAVVDTAHHSGAYSVHGPDTPGTSDTRLLLNSAAIIPPNATSALLVWWQRYEFEASSTHYYDGGVLELSTDDGATWTDAGALLSDPYPVTIYEAASSPLAGRPAWGGSTGSNWVPAQANLMGYRGLNLLFRFRLGTDGSNSVQADPAGWWIDDLVLVYQSDVVCAPYSWDSVAPYPQAMGHLAVAPIEDQDRIYAFGGLYATANTISYLYDPPTNAWSPIAHLPAGRYDATAVGDGISVYILGGRDGNHQPTNTVYRYLPLFNNYGIYPTMSESVSAPGAAYLNDLLYRIGGKTITTTLASVEALTQDPLTWTPRASLPHGVSDTAVAVIGNYIYVAGGLTGTGYQTATNKTYRYDPATDAWSDAAIADLPDQRADMASAVYNGQWVLAGGMSSNADKLASIIAWNPATNKWISRARLPEPHTLTQGAAAGGAFFAPAGVDAQTYTSTVLKYTESACPAPTACPVQFTDVPEDNPFYTYVRCLACRNIVSGYSDSPPCTTGVPCFLPNNNVTRGQIAKFISNAANYTDAIPSSRQTFTDVPNTNAFWLYIERAYAHGVIGGYANSLCTTGVPCYLPNNNVTRGQAAKFVSNSVAYNDAIPSSQQTFTDVPNTNAFWLYIERAAAHGVIGGYSDNPPCGTGVPCFLWGNNVTRGQTAKFISNAFSPNCQTPNQAKK